MIAAQRQRAENGDIGDIRDDEADVVPRIALPDGQLYEHEGEVDFVGAEVDPLTGTVPIRATFANPDALLLHGQFATVVLTSQEPENKIVIPVSAVQEDQAGAYVLVLSDDKLAEIRRIERGPTQEVNPDRRAGAGGRRDRGRRGPAEDPPRRAGYAGVPRKHPVAMFSAFFINRPKFALVISIVMVLVGAIALQALPVAQSRTWCRRRCRLPPAIRAPTPRWSSRPSPSRSKARSMASTA